MTSHVPMSSSNVLDFVKEAEQILDEIQYAITSGWISHKLENTRECAYINITTREGEQYCVRLSWRGFEVIFPDYNYYLYCRDWSL